MTKYLKVNLKNYNYITNYNNYYAILINLFLLFLFFIKNDYQLIIIYSFIVSIIYFIFYDYFVISLIIIPMLYLLNIQKNILEANEKYEEKYDFGDTIAPGISKVNGLTDSANKEADDAKNRVREQSQSNEPSECEKAFMLATETRVDTAAVAASADTSSPGGDQNERDEDSTKAAISETMTYDTENIGGTSINKSIFSQ